MVGMSGESWHHKSTLSPIPGSQDYRHTDNPPFYLFIFKFISIL